MILKICLCGYGIGLLNICFYVNSLFWFLNLFFIHDLVICGMKYLLPKSVTFANHTKRVTPIKCLFI